MATINRRVLVAVFVGLLGTSVPSAQDEVSEVRQAIDGARAAALAKDVKAYERFIADDLRWINLDGTIWGKQERLKEIPTGAPPPVQDQPDVKVHGDSATVIFTTRVDDGRRRVVRSYVKRDGRWQLVLHAAMAMK